MKVLVTGANGFIGRSLCGALRSKHYAVVAALRSLNMSRADIEQVVINSIDGSSDWVLALKTVDVVVHLAARVHIMNDNLADPLAEFRKVNVEGTLNLARQAAAVGVKRLIFISSVKVNGEATSLGSPFTEQNIANPQDAYAISKFEAEQGLLELATQTGMEVVIIRPPLVYGAGVKANFANMMRAIKRGLPLPLGAIYNKRSFVSVQNLVSLIVHCIEHPAAANQVFLVSDGYDLSTTELLRQCAAALGVKSRLIPVPQKLIEFGAYILGKNDLAQRVCGNLQVDISKARTLLGWEPPFSVKDGLRSTADGVRNTYS